MIFCLRIKTRCSVAPRSYCRKGNYSAGGGTGKSNTTANLAALLASEGKRVGVIDTDIQSPGIHVLFGLQEEDMTYSLNDYLWGNYVVVLPFYITPPF